MMRALAVLGLWASVAHALVPRRASLARRMTMMADGGIKVGVAGATGAVGVEIVQCLEKSKLAVDDLRLFGSARSAGKEQDCGRFGSVTLEEFDLERARSCDVIFLAVGGDFSVEYANKICADGGPVVIDNSSAFRMDKDVPLVVPEINGKLCKKAKLLANPNCTTAIALMALAPLHKAFGIKRVIMSTYQAASGAGAAGMAELTDGVNEMAAGASTAPNEVFAHPLPFNVIPHIDKFQENGYTKEEMKVTWETRKILEEPDMPVSCTAVRIPTLRAHSEAITLEFDKDVDVEEAKKLLAEAPGVKLVDEVDQNK
mmetsp:Transcript_13756/g.40695  ORF Transcript_13756/g.40695 Transcript_13756/m.40695 type:complete len:315 (-) Transcript_13756:400-1344(-)